MWVLIIAFPINVARKNFQNGTPNCPHIMPARSKRGFGTYRWKKEKRKRQLVKSRIAYYWKLMKNLNISNGLESEFMVHAESYFNKHKDKISNET